MSHGDHWSRRSILSALPRLEGSTRGPDPFHSPAGPGTPRRPAVSADPSRLEPISCTFKVSIWIRLPLRHYVHSSKPLPRDGCCGSRARSTVELWLLVVLVPVTISQCDKNSWEWHRSAAIRVAKELLPPRAGSTPPSPQGRERKSRFTAKSCRTAANLISRARSPHSCCSANQEQSSRCRPLVI